MASQWTPGELATLRALAGTASAEEIAAALPGRTPAGVKDAAHTRGISLRRVGERHPRARYADAEVEALRELHLDGVPPRELRRRFPHMPRATIHNFIYYINRVTQ